jgi:hypothetical protein
MQATKLTNILLSNASHEGALAASFLLVYVWVGADLSLVRTPLNHIIKWALCCQTSRWFLTL